MTVLLQQRTGVAAFVIVSFSLLFTVHVHLLPALLAGLLVHELVHALAPRLFGGKNLGRAKVWALFVLIASIVGALLLLVLTVVLFLSSEQGSLSALLEKLAEVLERARETLPASLRPWLPEQGSDLGEYITSWLRAHAQDVQAAGGAFGHVLAVSLIGMVIGALVSLKEVTKTEELRYFAGAMADSIRKLAEAFRRIVFAQLQISALNTFFTAIFLMVVLPVVGVGHLPFSKTLVLVTFLVGLLPVIGNLISNTVITIIALTHSLEAAVGSLIFLILIHKLEYFVNARIIGTQIQSSAWELLTAMLVMQAVFGIPGVVIAPIFYAYVKSEMRERSWI